MSMILYFFLIFTKKYSNFTQDVVYCFCKPKKSITFTP